MKPKVVKDYKFPDKGRNAFWTGLRSGVLIEIPGLA